VRDIVQAAQGEGYRFQDIILGIVASAPFQMRQARKAEEGAPR
jgi:hypothetical protein